MSSQGDLSVLESEEIGKRRQTGSSVREESEGLQAPREEELTGAGVSLADPFLILCDMERRCRRGSAMEKFVEECERRIPTVIEAEEEDWGHALRMRESLLSPVLRREEVDQSSGDLIQQRDEVDFLPQKVSVAT